MQAPSSSTPRLQPLYYVDRRGEVQRDNYRGPLARIYRLVTSLWRNYNLFQVYHHAEDFDFLDHAESKHFDNALRKKLRFTAEEWKGLKQVASNDENQLLRAVNSDFFAKIAGNRAFNAKVSAMINLTRQNPYDGMKIQTLEALRAYSHKTEHGNFVKMMAAADKVTRLITTYKLGETPEENEKLTIQDVRALESLVNMRPLLKRFKEISFGETPTHLSQLVEKSKIAKDFVVGITAAAHIQAPCKPGTFILYDMETDYALRGQRVSGLQRFIFNRLLGTNISHISVGYQNIYNESIEAHMWGSPVSKFTQGPRTLGNHCFRTFTLDPKTLVDAKDHGNMRALYGADWGDTVAEKYAKIVREYFNTEQNPTLSTLRNPSIRRLLAAIGFRYSLFQRTWEERAQFPEHGQVICSEFAVLSSLQCLAKLNEQIAREWGEQGEIPAPKLNPPVRENRRLNRVVPHEVLQRSIATGTGVISEQAPVIRAYVQCNTAPLIY